MKIKFSDPISFESLKHFRKIDLHETLILYESRNDKTTTGCSVTEQNMMSIRCEKENH